MSRASTALPGAKASVIAHVRRGDVDILPRPDLVREFDDRVGLLAHRDDFAATRNFGASIKSTAESSYVSIGLGMAAGFLIGAISIPIPGVGRIAGGLSGVLQIGLILGNFRRTGGRLNSMIFPGMTIVKIVFVDVVPALVK